MHSTDDGGKAERKDKLKEFIMVVQDVLPLLDLMKNTIEEGSSKIPKVSDQLNNVTHATETATVEILDVLDSMSRRVEAFEQMLVQLGSRNEKLTLLGKTISERLKTNPEMDDVEKLWSEYHTMVMESDLFAAASKSLADEKADNMSIAMALQVQDITSQQIAGAVHLIESVRDQLTHVLTGLERNEKPSLVAEPQNGKKQTEQAGKVFDIDAQFTHSSQRQEEADEIINQWTNRSSEK